MPEHYGLNTATNPNVFENTISIKTNWLFAWLTNYNNLHTAHHHYPYIPMCNIKILHAQNKHLLKVSEPSYFTFYRKVVKGEIFFNPNENCLTR